MWTSTGYTRLHRWHRMKPVLRCIVEATLISAADPPIHELYWEMALNCLCDVHLVQPPLWSALRRSCEGLSPWTLHGPLIRLTRLVETGHQPSLSQPMLLCIFNSLIRFLMHFSVEYMGAAIQLVYSMGRGGGSKYLWYKTEKRCLWKIQIISHSVWVTEISRGLWLQEILVQITPHGT